MISDAELAEIEERARFGLVSSSYVIELIGEVRRLRTALAAQTEYTKIEYGGCGGLQWTIDKWGRMTHKHGCPNRTDPWCQTHPDGCPDESNG